MDSKKFGRLLLNLMIALEAVFSNKLRSFLTALGIIFGVASVITMLAIGNGAKKEILDQLELVGANNISIKPIFNGKQTNGVVEDNSNKENEEKYLFSSGLNLKDEKNIIDNLPGVTHTSPEIITDALLIRKGLSYNTQMIGITNNYLSIFDLKILQGTKFTKDQLENGLPVCIIGNEIKNHFIDEENPIGEKIKCNDQWLTIIGILEPKHISEKALENNKLDIRNYNTDVYLPIKTMLIRYENRSLITGNMLAKKRKNNNTEYGNYHQLDRLVVKINSEYDLGHVAEILYRILQRRHNDVIDFEIVIPELLLSQQQKAKRIFSIVLAVIAGISLLVGGIGIMNIMLASVMERIKEIGLRIAVGAKRSDIIQQFLFEAISISLTGGIIGIILGIILSILISYFTGITTIITFYSAFISFLIAVFTGLVFGITPARNASRKNPIKSLRHD